MRNQKGFTFVELVIVMGIVSILFGFITISLLTSQRKAYLSSATDTLISDIKNQQIKTMTSSISPTDTLSQSYGIYFEANKYTLFKGSSYSPSDPSNFIVPLDGNLQFSNISFPGSVLVFAKRSGEILNFTEGSNSITIKSSTSTPEQKTMTINRFGAIISLN